MANSQSVSFQIPLGSAAKPAWVEKGKDREDKEDQGGRDHAQDDDPQTPSDGCVHCRSPANESSSSSAGQQMVTADVPHEEERQNAAADQPAGNEPASDDFDIMRFPSRSDKQYQPCPDCGRMREFYSYPTVFREDLVEEEPVNAQKAKAPAGDDDDEEDPDWVEDEEEEDEDGDEED